MLVKKHNGQKRVVVDMRKINGILKDEVFNTLTLREMVERVGAAKAQVFSLMDLRSAYHQILIDEDSRKFVAFHVPGMGNYQYTRLPFGLKLSGNYFNHLVGTAIAEDEILSRYCMAYVDDVFVYTVDIESHLFVLRRLLEVLRKVGLKIHNEKCEFMKDKVKFVGHIFGKDGIEPEFGKIEAMSTFPTPRTKKQLRSFIGLVTFYRQYIKNLSHDLEPLLILLRKDERFVWNEEREAAFQSIREKLKDLPTLAFPDESEGAGPFVLETDASSYSIAGTLAQRSRDGKEDHLIACYGRSLRPNEIAYTTCEKECLALISGIVKFKHIFGGKKLIVKSDNLNVKYFNSLRGETSPRMSRWSTYCSSWLAQATFEHVKGPQNIVPDALSRREYPDDEPLSERELEITQDIMIMSAVYYDIWEEACGPEEYEEEDNRLLHLLRWKIMEDGALQDKIIPVLDGEIEDDDESKMEKVNRVSIRDEVRHEKQMHEYYLQGEPQDPVSDTNDPVLGVMQLRIRKLFQSSVSETATCNVLTTRQEKDEEETQRQDISLDEIFEEDEPDEEGEGVSTPDIKEMEEVDNPEIRYKPNMFSFMEHDEQALKRAQQECPEIGPLMRYLESKELPVDDDHLTRRVLFEAERHFLNDNGILCGFKKNTNKRTGVLRDMVEWKVIPKALRREVLKIVHESTHPGRAKTLAILEDLQYQWPGMYSDVKRYVGSCENCATGKKGLFMPKSKTENMEIPTCPMEQLSIDIVGPLTATTNGNVYILTVQDVFSGYVWLLPLQEQTSQQIAERLVEVFSFAGVPSRIITDLGQNLVSTVIREVCAMLNITHFKTLAYVHKSNRVERTHRVIGDMIRTMLKESEIGRWDKYLHLMAMYLRTQATATNPYSPAEIVFGRKIRTPTSAQIEAFERTDTTDVSEYVEELKNRLKLILEAQTKCREMNNEEVKRKANKDARPFQARKGMRVYLRNDSKKTGISQKLQKEFTGPYEIVDVLSNHSLRLRNLSNKKILKHPIHVDRVKPVVERLDEVTESSDLVDLVEGGIGRSPGDIQQDKLVGVGRETGPAGPDLPIESSPTNRATPRGILKDTTTLSTSAARTDGGESKTVHFGDDITDDVYEIERIINVKGSGDSMKYLVKWRDTPTEKFTNSWVSAKDVTQSAIDRFHERKTKTGKTRAVFRRGRVRHRR
jgi:hypothetical protein